MPESGPSALFGHSGAGDHLNHNHMKKTITLLMLAAAFAAGNTALAQCPAGQSQVQITILTDTYGDETTWEVTGAGGSPVYGSGGPYGNSQTYTPTVCVPNGPVIVFTIYDSYGDGICCQFGQGNYTVSVGGQQVASGGQFTDLESTMFVAGPQVPLDLAVLTIGLNSVIQQGNQTITGSIRNFGTSPVNNFTLNYSVNNGPTVSQPVTASIAPGASYNYSHGTPWNATVGAQTVKVWASSPNGQADANPLNDELEMTVSVATQSVQRRALMEQFTSSTCPPCAGLENTWGPVLTTANTNQTGSNIAAIKYHLNFPSPGNDPSYNPDANTRRTYYGVNGIPSRFMDGSSFNTSTAAFLNNAAARPAYMDVNVSYTASGNNITVNVTVTPYANFTGNHRLFIAITEDQYTYTAGTTSQSLFKYVMRKMLPNANGITLTNLTAGVPQTFSESYTFGTGAPAPGNYNLWTNLDNCTVVAFVQNTSSTDVVQANFAPIQGAIGIEENELSRGLRVFPNPANDELNVRFDLHTAGNVYMEITNALGQRVISNGQSFASGTQIATLDLGSLAPGMYHLTITSGDLRATRTISVTR
jgi:hypothetical protein